MQIFYFFLNLSKNVELVTTKEILTETKNLYENIYKKKHYIINSNDFFNISDIKQLTGDGNDSCEGKFSIAECGLALLYISNGLTTVVFLDLLERYKTFFMLI